MTLHASSWHYVDRICKIAHHQTHRSHSARLLIFGVGNEFCRFFGANFASLVAASTWLHGLSVCELTTGQSHALTSSGNVLSGQKHSPKEEILSEMTVKSLRCLTTDPVFTCQLNNSVHHSVKYYVSSTDLPSYNRIACPSHIVTLHFNGPNHHFLWWKSATASPSFWQEPLKSAAPT